jgi:hypothetical protein
MREYLELFTTGRLLVGQRYLNFLAFLCLVMSHRQNRKIFKAARLAAQCWDP